MVALRRKLGLVLIDILIIVLSIFLSVFIKYEGALFGNMNGLIHIIFTSIIVTIPIFCIFNLYNSLWRYASIDELLYIVSACALSTAMIVLYLVITGYSSFSFSMFLLYFITTTILVCMCRLSYRVLRRLKLLKGNAGRNEVQRVMIIGAGDAGAMVMREIQKSSLVMKKPVAFIDDDRAKHQSRIMGVRVYGGRDIIQKTARELSVQEIIIAMPSVPRTVIKEIIEECKKTRCRLKILPGIYELINGEVSVNQIRDVQIEDLLGREAVKVDLEEITGYIKDEVVLVTGGGGSIGSELCRHIAGFSPRKLLILDIYENNVYDLQQELKSKYRDLDFHVLIASVRDKARLEEIFSTFQPAVVFHAAAHKHVPLMEDNPAEAIKNNVFGTLNTAECADKYNSKRFVLISTDKAVNPTNIMGTTKRIAEMIIQSMDMHSKTEYVAVRFGNVLGSNGSVIPLFKKQIQKGGPVTVTHPEINRFFMTISEAVQLVIQCGAMAKGGEIFVLDMGQPVKIADLARDLIKLSGFEPGIDIQIQYTGLRPGEKLYEELLMEEEDLQSTKHEKIFIGKPTYTNINALRKELEKLKFVMTGSRDKLTEFLEELVPTYKRVEVETAVTVDGER